MKTAAHVDVQRSQAVAQQVSPTQARCYWNAYRAALAIGANACYCEGWVLLPLTLPGQQGFTMVAHGWVELGGQVIDMEGAGAIAYFASSRRVHSQVQPQDLPLHAHDKQADRRHQRTMHKAIAHMLTLSPTWATIVAAADPPIS